MLEVVNKDLAIFNTDVDSSYVWCICRNFLVFVLSMSCPVLVQVVGLSSTWVLRHPDLHAVPV